MRSGLRFWIPVALFALITVIVQQYYVVRSEGRTPGALTEFPFVSSTHLTSFLKERRETWSDTVFTDTLSYSAAPLLGYYINPSRVIFLSDDWYDGISNPHASCEIDPCPFVAPGARFDAFAQMRSTRAAWFRRTSFDFSPGDLTSSTVDHLRFDVRGTDKHLTEKTQFVEQIRESVLNHWPQASPIGPIYRIMPSPSVRNHLVFLSGSLSTHYGIYGGIIGLYAIENDPYRLTDTAAWLGRYLLFRAIAPSAHVRMMLSVTASLNGPSNDTLPPIAVIGKTRVPLHLVGRGSARVFSDVIVPQSTDDMRFIGLDMGRAAQLLPQPPRSGLMSLYGRDTLFDGRLVTALARDISLVPEGEYEAMRIPTHVASFPADLGNPDLQYSGVFEDGWISDRAYFILQAGSIHSKLIVRALIPQDANATYRAHFCVRLDENPPRCNDQGAGEFTFEEAVARRGTHRVDLEVANPRVFNSADQRPLGAKLDFVGFSS